MMIRDRDDLRVPFVEPVYIPLPPASPAPGSTADAIATVRATWRKLVAAREAADESYERTGTRLMWYFAYALFFGACSFLAWVVSGWRVAGVGSMGCAGFGLVAVVAWFVNDARLRRAYAEATAVLGDVERNLRRLRAAAAHAARVRGG